MSIQVLIIGLGQFGMSLARTLSEKGTEVIAVDQDKELVDEAAGFLDDALCLDATDETALGKLCPKERDVVICAIGAREPSILTTAILRQMGCDNVIARATDKIHERILKAVGAKNVINPDAEYGKKFAYKILFQNIIADETSEDIQLLEINVQPFMVAAIKKGNKLARPFPNEILNTKDKLLLVCTEDAIAKMIEENK